MITEPKFENITSEKNEKNNQEQEKRNDYPEKINLGFTGTRKVVQLVINGRAIIRFGDGSYSELHADIVRKALKEFGINDFQEEKTKDGFRPAQKGNGYEVVGAGLGTVINDHKMTFGSYSSGYNIEISEENIKKVAGELDIDFFVSNNNT